MRLAVSRQPAIGKEIVSADTTVASQLALTKGERVVRIHCVRLTDSIPVSFDETYLPLEIVGKSITDFEGRAYFFDP